MGDRQPIELLRDDAAWAAEPARLATALGHTVELDGAQRWTCTCCGRAVLCRGVNIYGTAATEPCLITVTPVDDYQWRWECTCGERARGFASQAAAGRNSTAHARQECRLR